MVLDLGCGNKKVEGSIGVDLYRLPGVDLIFDLSRPPYPFATGSVDRVHLRHVLEHMDNPVEVLAEIWRISKPGAGIHIRVPHYTGPYAWRDPTHKRCFSSGSFSYFGANGYSYYTPARFSVGSLRLNYSMRPPYRRAYRIWAAFVQSVLDRHPTFGERYLAYLIGGIDEIQVTLLTVKQDPC